MDAFTRDLGTRQGRLLPVGWAPVPEGEAAFVLGYDLPGHTEELNIGDYCQVSQVAEFAGAAGDTRLLFAQARLRPPAAMPAGTAWELTLRVDGTVRARHRLPPGRTRNVTLAANVAKASAGNHTIAVRLELVAA